MIASNNLVLVQIDLTCPKDQVYTEHEFKLQFNNVVNVNPVINSFTQTDALSSDGQETVYEDVYERNWHDRGIQVGTPNVQWERMEYGDASSHVGHLPSIKELAAKLEAARTEHEQEKLRTKTAVKALLEAHRKEIKGLTAERDQNMLDAAAIRSLREDVQRLECLQQLRQSPVLAKSSSSDGTPDMDAGTISSACSSAGEEAPSILPPRIRTLCSRLLREGKEVLFLTERHQLWNHLSPSPEQVTSSGQEEALDGGDQIKARGDTILCKEVQCNLLEWPENPSIAKALLDSQADLKERAEWLQQMTTQDIVCTKPDLVPVVRTLFVHEQRWLSEQIQGMLVHLANVGEQNAVVSSPPDGGQSTQLLTRDWWQTRVEKLSEHQASLVGDLVSAVHSSLTVSCNMSASLDNQQSTLQKHHDLSEQLESCKWQIQKQKELLEYKQHHEEALRQEFHSHLEQEKVNSDELNRQVREWRERCTSLENLLASRQNEMTKLGQSLEQSQRDLEHVRSDVDLEKFHGQQLVQALESERRIFNQLHNALFTERKRREAAHKKDTQLIQHLQSVLASHNLSDRGLSSVTSPPIPDPPELFYNTSLQFGGSLPVPETTECVRCSLRNSDDLRRDAGDLTLGIPLQPLPNSFQRLFRAPQTTIEVLRLRRHHDSLCVQKRYLLRLLCAYQATEEASQSALKRLGACTPPLLPVDMGLLTGNAKKPASFRVAALAVVSMIRLSKMYEAFRDFQLRQGPQVEGASNGHQQLSFIRG